MFMVAYSSNRPDIEHRDIGLGLQSARRLRPLITWRVPAGLDQFANALGVGIHNPETVVARRLPGLQPAVELANVVYPIPQGYPQPGEQGLRPRRRRRSARPCGAVSVSASSADPVGRHVGGKNSGNGRGKGSLLPHIEQAISARSSSAQRTCEGVMVGGVMDGGPGSGRGAFLGILALTARWHPGRSASESTRRATSCESKHAGIMSIACGSPCSIRCSHSKRGFLRSTIPCGAGEHVLSRYHTPADRATPMQPAVTIVTANTMSQTYPRPELACLRGQSHARQPFRKILLGFEFG